MAIKNFLQRTQVSQATRLHESETQMNTYYATHTTLKNQLLMRSFFLQVETSSFFFHRNRQMDVKQVFVSSEPRKDVCPYCRKKKFYKMANDGGTITCGVCGRDYHLSPTEVSHCGSIQKCPYQCSPWSRKK